MKQCPNCGFILNDNDTTCFKCNLNFEQYETEQNSMPDDVAQEVFQQAPSPLAQQPLQPTYQNQKYCTGCGQTNNSNSKFCGSCGNKLESVPINETNNIKVEPTSNPTVENEYVKHAQLSSLRYRKKSYYASLTTDELDKMIHARTLYHITFISTLLTLCVTLSLIIGGLYFLIAINS